MKRFMQFAMYNAPLATSLVVAGGLVGWATSLNNDSQSRFPNAIAYNGEVVSALEALEEVLPTPKLLHQVVCLVNQLCLLEHTPTFNSTYIAVELEGKIAAELTRLTRIPWLEEAIVEYNQRLITALSSVTTNISHEVARLSGK